MSDARISATIDERARLVMALLAASEWPQMEQAMQPHAVHYHSKQTRQFVSQFRDHAAVQGLNHLLASGATLAELFTATLRCHWPQLTPVEPLPGPLVDETWLATLAPFHEDSSLDVFWRDHQEPWQEAVTELTAIFRDSRIIQFLNQLMERPLGQSIHVIPSVVYPMLHPVLAETDQTLFLILPPAKAWGESPPWPFGEDPGWVVAQTCWHLSAFFLTHAHSRVADTFGQLDDARRASLRHAVVTLCLEQEFDEAEAMAYLVRSKKEHGLPQLPLIAEGLREYLAAPEGRSLLEMIS